MKLASTGGGAAWQPNRLAARATAAVLVIGAGIGFAAGCDTARVVAPPLPLRAASAALYAVDVEFAEPLQRASAEDPSRYTVYPEGDRTAAAEVLTATLIDTVSLRVVQLVLPAWFGDSATDRRATVVETHGVLDYFGRSTGERRAVFRTGLGYDDSMRGFFDARCSSCHGATNPGGGYRTDSYAALFAPGTSPAPNVIAGNPNCLVVVRCRPGNSMYQQARLGFLDYDILLNWVTVYQARR